MTVPYYPPVFPTAVFPSDAAQRLLADGLRKLHRIIASCEPSIILSSSDYQRLRKVSMWWQRRSASLGWPDLPTYSTDTLPAAGRTAAESSWLVEWIAQRSRLAPSEEIACIMYTSGSTGDPKVYHGPSLIQPPSLTRPPNLI